MLRDLFPFIHQVIGQKNAAATRSLLETIDSLPSLDAAALLTSRAIPSIAEESSPQKRFNLLEDIRQTAERILPTLENQVMQAVLPMPYQAKNAAIHADNLLKSLAASYADLATETSSPAPNTEASHLYHWSIRCAITLLARRQFLAYRAYAMPSEASWQLLHKLYLMACAPEAKALNSETAPIEHEYLGALLFAFMEPGNLPRTELAATQTCTHQLAAYAAVGQSSPALLAKAPDASFLIPPGEGSPGYPLTRLPAGISLAEGLIIDCSQVVAALDRNLSRSKGKAVQPVLDAPPSLLQSQRTMLTGKSMRRFNRTKFKPHADLIGGLDAVINFLNGNVFSRRAHDGIGRHDSRTFVASEWSLIDEGPDGFLVRFIKGEKSKIGVGDLVALQPRESSKTHICLVRRIASVSGRLELGLQLLSPQVSVVDIKSDHHPVTRGLFLHNLPAYGKHAGLIIPPGKLTAGQKITVNTLGQNLHRQIGKCIEVNEGLEFVALDLLPD
ncbi:MAG: hypothetical protein KAX99_01200 [Azonexus sp.]|nr:hypothetical protein [Azonexus sp.]